MPWSRLRGVGIDLVSVGRMRRFLKRHPQDAFQRILSTRERKNLRSQRLSAIGFSKIFAAKEAFFKALNRPWLGLEGFASMSVRFLDPNRFQIRARAFRGLSEGCFFGDRKWVGAQVILWKAR